MDVSRTGGLLGNRGSGVVWLQRPADVPRKERAAPPSPPLSRQSSSFRANNHVDTTSRAEWSRFLARSFTWPSRTTRTRTKWARRTSREAEEDDEKDDERHAAARRTLSTGFRAENLPHFCFASAEDTLLTSSKKSATKWPTKWTTDGRSVYGARQFLTPWRARPWRRPRRRRPMCECGCRRRSRPPPLAPS